VSATFQGVGSGSGTLTYTTSGAAIDTTHTCGVSFNINAGSPNGQYTATSNTILIGGSGNGPDGGTCTQISTLTL
jgi:hypothetical protein